MSQWIWILYGVMALLCLRSLLTLMQQHRVRHQYEVLARAQQELNNANTKSPDEQPSANEDHPGEQSVAA